MKKILFSLVTLLTVLGLSAAPISEQQARKIAADFFAAGGRSVSGDVTLAWAGNSISDQGGRSASDALLYIYNRNTTGFVIIAGDNSMSKQVLAYSTERAIDINNLAPANRAIINAWGKQVEAARNGNTKAQQVAYAANENLLYTTAEWNQGAPFNNEAPVMDGLRAVTGCAATAMAIICHYHKYPTKGVGTTPAYTYQDNYGATRSIPENTLGRTYNYANMLSNYNNGYTSTQGNAVAALMKDMGTSIKMAYNPGEWGGSGAFGMDVPIALTTYFGYSKQAIHVGHGNRSEEAWQAVVRENIKQYGPTFFEGQGDEGGHAFVLDGYNTDGYFHINYGWGGVGNDYYYLPRIEYYSSQGAVFYLEPDPNGTSTYRDYLTLTAYTANDIGFIGLSSEETEYAPNTPFKVAIGAIYNNGTAPFVGQVLIALCNRAGQIKEEVGSIKLTNLNPGYITYMTPSIQFTTTPADGDRIRLFYKGQYSDNQWHLFECRDEETFNDLVIKAGPEDVADALHVGFDKSAQGLYFMSDIMPLHLSVKDPNGAAIGSISAMMAEEIELEISDYTPGEYTFEISSGSAPYVLKVVF